MKFSSHQKDLRTLLTSGFYKVPRFQRPYSWGREELEEFWADTIVEGDPDYFIGSIVVFIEAPGRYGVVDGQQRLTTITMLLCAIRDAFAQEGQPKSADGLHTLIEKPAVESSLPEYVLFPETSHPYFQEYIQKRDEPEVPEALGDEEKALKKAYEFVVAQVEAAISGIRDDSTLSDKRRATKIRAKLEDIRDKLLGLSLIFVELDDEDDAYLVFETLNARGKDLRVSDLVKNHLTRHLKKKTKTVDTVRERWMKVLQTIEGSGASITVDSFIHHHWLSTRDFVSTKKLFKAIRKRVGKAGASAYLDVLVSESRLYRDIFEPLSGTWQKTETAIRDSLRALNIFQVRQATPLALSLLARLREGCLKPKHVADALNAVEVFHFQFTAIASQSSSGGLSMMYAKYARLIREATDAERCVRVIRDLKNALKGRLPSADEFDAGFLALRFSDMYTKDRKLVRYTLGRLARKGLNSKVLDYEQMTIEHITPQSSTVVSTDKIANVGNLILVDAELNNKIANKEFNKKKPRLERATDVWVDEELARATTWEEAEIDGRAKFLAKQAREKVWRI